MFSHIEVLHPIHREFEYRLKNSLKLHGLWRGKLQDAQDINLGRYYTWFLCAWFPLNFFGVVLYIKQHIKEDVYVLAGPVTDIFLFGLTSVFLFMSQTEKYEKQMENYYNEIHVLHYEPRDDYILEEIHLTEKRCYLMYRCLNWLFIIGCIFYDTIPIISNVVSGGYYNETLPLDTCQYVWLPFDYKYDNVLWFYATLIFTYNTLTLSYIVVYINIIMLCVLIHLVTRLRILNHNLRGLSAYVNDNKVMLTPEEDYEITNKMRDVHEHHLLLLDALERFKDFFGPAVLAAFTYDTVALCVIFLLLFKNPVNFVRYGGLGVAVVGQLAGQSYAMEVLSSSVEDLRLTLFDIPWYAMSMKNQRAINIMVILSQIPFNFDAVGVVRVNMQAMATIMKSSLSYFIWLKTMGSESQ